MAQGNRGLWSVHTISSLLLLPYHVPLLQRGVLSTESRPSGTNSSTVGPLHAVAPARSLLLRGLVFKACSFLQSTSTCSGTGLSAACTVDICSTMVFHGQIPAPAWVPLHRLQLPQERFICSAQGSPGESGGWSPSFCSRLGVDTAVLSSFSPHPSLPGLRGSAVPLLMDTPAPHHHLGTQTR